MPNKLTIEDMQKIAKERDGKCLSKNYKNKETKLLWKCNKDGYEWWATSGSIKNNNNWCPKCSNHIKHTIEEMHNIAKERDGKCLSKEYINAHTNIIWKCNKDGYEWESCYHSISKGSWCPKCNNKLKLNIGDMKKIAEERNGVCLSNKYINSSKKLRWKCNVCDTIWKAPYTNIYSGSWCPNCRSMFYSESIFRKIIEQRTGLKWPKKRPQWMKVGKNGPRELDIYNKELKIAIEYNDHKSKLYKGFQKLNNTYEKQKAYDIIKEQRCKNNDVKLIWVPLMKIEDMDDYIKKLCRENNIEIVNNEKLDYKELSNHSRLLEGLKECRRIAKERDGELLSNYYLGANKKLRWKCNKDGYEWDASLSTIKRGCWCPKCSGHHKYTIQDIKKIAIERDGECLSKEYKGLKYKLLWKCNKHNYIFKISLGSILYQNVWCPICKGVLYTIDYMKNIAKKRGGDCLSTEYKNIRTKLRWRCNKDGYEWYATPQSIINGGWCHKCINRVRYNISDINNELKKYNLTLLSEEYRNCKEKLKIKCNICDYIFEQSFRNIMRNSKCPKYKICH